MTHDHRGADSLASAAVLRINRITAKEATMQNAEQHEAQKQRRAQRIARKLAQATTNRPPRKDDWR